MGSAGREIAIEPDAVPAVRQWLASVHQSGTSLTVPPVSRKLIEECLASNRQARLESDRRAFEKFIRTQPKPTTVDLVAALRWHVCDPTLGEDARFHALCLVEALADELKASLKSGYHKGG